MAAINEAIGEHSAMVAMNNRVAKLTAEAKAKRTDELADWQEMASFSDGWMIPATSAAGIQAIVEFCCTCGAGHIYDYRIQDGLVEFRSYGVKHNDGISAEDGAGASEARARIGQACA